MSEFTERLASLIEDKVRDDLHGQHAGVSRGELRDLVDYQMGKLAEKMFKFFEQQGEEQ